MTQDIDLNPKHKQNPFVTQIHEKLYMFVIIEEMKTTAVNSLT